MTHPAVPNLANGLTCHAVYCSGPGATSNVAAYHAPLDALRAIYHTGWRGPFVLCGDSKLVIEQYNGRW